MYCQIIASASREELSIENNLLHDSKCMDRLNAIGVDYVPCMGVYEGVLESSFLINVYDKVIFDMLKAVFFGVFNQESILVLRDLQAELLFKSGGYISLGTFIEVTKSEAERNDAYTYLDRKYFICKELTVAPDWGSCSEETKQAESEMLHDKDKEWFVTEGQLCEVEI
jgi:hypothetical protein